MHVHKKNASDFVFVVFFLHITMEQQQQLHLLLKICLKKNVYVTYVCIYVKCINKYTTYSAESRVVWLGGY